MMAINASMLGIIYGVSECGLSLFKRANAGTTTPADRGSLRLLWGVIVISLVTGYSMPSAFPSSNFGPAKAFVYGGAMLFSAGLLLRWYSITYLGRFFNVNVAIAADHRLIDTGPYRWVRHPSYTGALMAFAGLGICLCNWAALGAILLPAVAVFSWRIRVEESALSAGLGDVYERYMSRTRRLIPGIY